MDPQQTPLYNLPTEQPGITKDDVVDIVNSMLANLNTATKLSNGYIQSQNYVHGVSGWSLTDSSAEFNVGVSVKSIDIPDTTTASSFHVDASGNAWWGANTATTYTGANAYILASGAAVFKNVVIGGTTIQYVVTNSGIFSYGDGNDGNATCDGSTSVAGMSLSGGSYTMTRDVYFNDLTINTGVSVNTGGYRIFVKDTLTVNGSITRNGNLGGTGGNGGNSGGTGPGSGGSGGAGLADGYLKGSVVGGAGAVGSGPNNGNSGDPHGGAGGANTTNSIGTNGIGSNTGGAGGAGAVGGSGGPGGTATTSNVRLTVGIQLAELLDVTSTGGKIKYDNSAGAGGGGSGGGGTQQATGGGGGGAGSGGGIIAVYARSIIIGASGSIQSNGGNGGNGGTGSSGTPQGGAGGGAGGSGANGGVVVLTYNTLANSGSITVTHGTKGTGGAGGAGSVTSGSTGSNGNDGSDGTIYLFQLSL